METASTTRSSPNPADLKDIAELRDRIAEFKSGATHEERFKHYRLTRGVYGQRQLGVHMFRTKIPYGKLTSAQLRAIADISEQVTNGNLHLTTRQNIQLHYVKLDDSPRVWEALAAVGMNAREACGNTVRNITASAMAGVDPAEPFDVTPYVHAMYEYFLRNPICQDMGRKIKIAFSSSEGDSAYTYFHDFGFIPRVDANGSRGFKVVVAGGLGAQSIVAQTAFEFLPANEIIPFTEAAVRVFDRYGEREKRFKARMKYLVKELGLDKFLELIGAERLALENQEVPVAEVPLNEHGPEDRLYEDVTPGDSGAYRSWLQTNVVPQKQKGWNAVRIKVPLGDLHAAEARALSDLVQHYAADDIRITVNQGLLLRFVQDDALPGLYRGLSDIGLASAGFGTIADVTSCPGTDTCNLAVTNSTALATRLENLVIEEYPQLINEAIQIKMSGCMNSCGQHMAADIGFHGSSIKYDGRVLPAMQIVLGGGVDARGEGFIAERIIKIPTRRIPGALRALLDHFLEERSTNETLRDFYWRNGRKYFYDLLKPYSSTDDVVESDFIDWGQKSDYVQAIGVGECAGVSYDLVSAILSDAHEKLLLARESLAERAFGDSIYHSYSAFVIGAKAILLSDDVNCNTHIGIINDFEERHGQVAGADYAVSWKEYVLEMKRQTPEEGFARDYARAAAEFVQNIGKFRILNAASQDEQKVINAHYKA